ncbi:MAG TPA: helicase RepA family protein [Rhodocyclaceae bacterium]|nr:helicase RepA family protein [Rhodocyclaceae bacterium]
MKFTMFPNTSGFTFTAHDIPWASLVQSCLNPPAMPTKESLPLIALASFGDKRTEMNSLRSIENVLCISGIEIDYDAGEVTPETAAAMLQFAGIESVIYTTPSHILKGQRWRVLAPLSREYEPSERREFVARLNGALGGIAAKESFNKLQSYYIGRVAGVEYVAIHVIGQPIDLLPNLPPMYPAGAAPKPASGAPLPPPRPYTPNSDEPIAIARCVRILTDAAPGERHAARLHAGKLAGGFVAGGVVEESAMLAALVEASDKISDTGETTPTEMAALMDGVETGRGEPIVSVRPPIDTASIGFGGELPAGAMVALLYPPTPAQRFNLLTSADLAALPPMTWAIRGILPTDGLAAIYGASGSGKSFLVLDMLLALAAGRDWLGHAIKKPLPAVYAALEGENGISARVKAHQSRHGDPGANVRYLLQPFNLLNPADVEALAAAIVATGCAGGVVAIDTLNRAAPGADENDSASMGAIIAAAKVLQTRLGGLVLLIHHSGKNLAAGLRGHSSLHAALDAAIEVSRDGERHTWKIAKSKDGEDGSIFPFTLQPVQIGTSEDGSVQTSCVIIPERETIEALASVRTPSGGNQRIALDALREMLIFAEHRGQGGAPGDKPCISLEAAIEKVRGRLACDTKRQIERANKAITGLVNRGCLNLREGWIWMP